jgi:hypothetical protein
MKRADHTPSSRGERHCTICLIRDDNGNEGVYHSIADIMNNTPKHRALRKEQYLPPLTISHSSGTSNEQSKCKTRTSSDARWCCVVRFTNDCFSNVLQDYAITPKVLGKDHYGKVRQCIHHKTFCAYTCKLMYKVKIGRLDHLHREVNLLATLDHQNITKMVGCYTDAK